MTIEHLKRYSLKDKMLLKQTRKQRNPHGEKIRLSRLTNQKRLMEGLKLKWGNLDENFS